LRMASRARQRTKRTCSHRSRNCHSQKAANWLSRILGLVSGTRLRWVGRGRTPRGKECGLLSATRYRDGRLQGWGCWGWRRFASRGFQSWVAGPWGLRGPVGELGRGEDAEFGQVWPRGVLEQARLRGRDRARFPGVPWRDLGTCPVPGGGR